VSPETLERDATIVLAAFSTPVKPKQKRKRPPSMYFRARKSTRIKIGKQQPSSKEPIIIEDSPTVKREESPSKTPITYERKSYIFHLEGKSKTAGLKNSPIGGRYRSTRDSNKATGD